MYNIQGTARANRLLGDITKAVSGAAGQSAIEVLSDEFTIETGDIATTSMAFAPMTCDGFLDLENSRIRIGGLITPTLNNTVHLTKTIGTPEKFMATTTTASTAVTTSRTGLIVGQTVAGTGITAGTTIAAITATGFTLSAATAATGFGEIEITLTGTATITAAATVAATATAAATAAQAVPFVGLNGGPPIEFKKGDYFSLVLASVTSLGIGRTLIPQIPYIARRNPGHPKNY